MEQHYLKQLQDSAAASSSTGTVSSQLLHGSAGDQIPDTDRVTEAAGQEEQVVIPPERPSPICLQETAEESPEVTNLQGNAA